MLDYRFVIYPVSAEHRIHNNDFSPVRLPLPQSCYLPKQTSHRQSRSRRTFRLLSSILPHRIARRIFPSTRILIDGPGSGTSRHLGPPNVLDVHRVASCYKRTSLGVVSARLQLLLTVWTGSVTISMLPDDVLLHIFLFYRVIHLDSQEVVHRLSLPSWRWYSLVHVCRKWRFVIFSSPNFLDLRLVCDPWTQRELTSIWPPLPIIIRDMFNWPLREDYNIEAAIVHPNRVCEINLHYATSSQLQRLVSAAQEQFPTLIHLMLGFDRYDSGPAPVLPDGFLGGSAPCLQSLALNHIPFPTLPKLLSSTTDLVHLKLWDIPHSGYISPEALVVGLSTLTRLEKLSIGLKYPLSRPDRENLRPPPLTRTVLPGLTRFEFKGVSEYLENLAARIDAPLLNSIYIVFFHQLIFDIPLLAQFMRRTARSYSIYEAHVDFVYQGVQVESLPPTQAFDEKSGLRIACRQSDWQLSSVAQVSTSFFPSIYMVEHLYIYGPR